ncbi:MAG: hypothetical protein ABSH39_04365 [Candidatus Acidiferrum sp.]|jgi:hypothetical protein
MLSESGVTLSASRAGYYQWLFLGAAFWNMVSAGATLFLLTDAEFRARMRFPGMPDSISLQLLAACLFVFGLGYYWVSRDLSRNRDLVKLGVVGKPLVFLVFILHALAKEIPVLLAAPSVVDLLFGVLFLEFLVRTQSKAQ